MTLDQPLVLIVEDKEKARNLRVELLEASGFAAIGVSSKEDAERELRACPAIDLLVTDVNLKPLQPRDKSGVELARHVKQVRPDLPIVGYSGRIQEGDLPKADLKLFHAVHLKGDEEIEKLKKHLQKWRKMAVKHRGSRIKQAEHQLARVVKRYKIDEYDFNLLREFIPAISLGSKGPQKPIEEVLKDAGYKLKIVQTDEGAALLGTNDVKIKSPVPIWLRQLEDHVVSEVYHFPELYASAPNEHEAIRLLLLLMVGYYHDLMDVPDKGMAPNIRQLKRYLKSVVE